MQQIWQTTYATPIHCGSTMCASLRQSDVRLTVYPTVFAKKAIRPYSLRRACNARYHLPEV